MTYFTSVLYVCFLTGGLYFVEIKSNPVIKTELGEVQGIARETSSGKTVNAYLGIPFAESPTGSKRFLPPQPAKPWKDVLKADHLPLSCFQYLHPVLDIVDWSRSYSNMTEDCLYLNIFVPNPKPENAAVMVWIYGGGFLVGSTNLELYDPVNLVSEEDVIVVSINYRINVFGFLKLEGTTVDGKMGLLDQVEALKWIQSNIRHFGGDPLRVTIFGESAGGMSVAMLLAEPTTKGLYSSAIVQSGPPSVINTFTRSTNHLNSKTIAEWVTSLNCFREDKNELLKCLQQVKPEDILSSLPMHFPFLFSPEVGDDFINKNQFNKANLLIGTTAQDGSAMVLMVAGDICPPYKECSPLIEDKLSIIKRMFQNTTSIAQEAVDFVYTDWYRPNDSAAILQQIVKLMTDILMICESKNLANVYFRNGNNVYFYSFNHIRSKSQYPKWMGAEHGTDIYFIFGRPLDKNSNFTKEEIEMSKSTMRFWANFAKYGNPNGKSELSEWPLYTSDGEGFMEISTNSTVRFGIRDQECAFWSKLFVKLSKECPKEI